MQYYGMTEKGDRDINEDNFLIEKFNNNFYLFLVSDGMGGYNNGDIASRLATDEVYEAIKFYGSKEGFVKGFIKANVTLLIENRYSNSKMGATMVGVLIDLKENSTKIANIGDSRAYLINDNIWHTHDHSIIQDLIDNKTITEETALNHPQKNVITRALGLKKNAKIDFIDKDLTMKYIILCSDGVSQYIKDEEFKEILKNHNPKESCSEIISRASKRDSMDNMTIIVIDVGRLKNAK